MKQVEYKLDNGWTVSKNEKGIAILHVTPIEGSIFRKEQFIDIPKEIFENIRNGERHISELFRKYKLHDLIFQWNRAPVFSERQENTDSKFYGRDFIAIQDDNRYFIEYELSQYGGGHRKIEITKEIYKDARRGDKSISDLFIKYNLYHLDVTEYDV